MLQDQVEVLKREKQELDERLQMSMREVDTITGQYRSYREQYSSQRETLESELAEIEREKKIAESENDQLQRRLDN